MPTKTKKRKAVRRVKTKKKGFNLFFFRGDAAISFLVLAVVIIGSLMLVGGLTPKLNKQDLNTVGVPETPSPPNGADNNLQLKTFKFKTCTDSAAVHFLLDVSGSMNFNNGQKIQNLRDALKFFANGVTDTAVLGLRTFSESTTLLVPINIGTKSKVAQAAQGLTANGGTYTRDAFIATKADLAAAVGNSKFKNYDFNLIFFSDGIPETRAKNTLCPGYPPRNEYCTDPQPGNSGCRCFDTDQDPLSVATEIKSLKNASGKNVRVFSVLLYDPVRDGHFEPKFKPLMKSIASPDSYFETTDEQQLKNIFTQIGQKVCN